MSTLIVKQSPVSKPNVKLPTPLGGSKPSVFSGLYRVPELILKNYGYWNDYKQYIPSHYEDRAKIYVRSKIYNQVSGYSEYAKKVPSKIKHVSSSGFSQKLSNIHRCDRWSKCG